MIQIRNDLKDPAKDRQQSLKEEDLRDIKRKQNLGIAYEQGQDFWMTQISSLGIWVNSCFTDKNKIGGVDLGESSR